MGGLHLVKTPERVRKFASEMKRWKGINPSLQIFLELGEFQHSGTLDATRKDVFPIIDALGLNEVELSQLGMEPEELASEVPAILLHTSEGQQVFPEGKANAEALEFAKKCASFLAKTGRFAAPSDLEGFAPEIVDSPAHTVGLGDTLSCAYFMAL